MSDFLDLHLAVKAGDLGEVERLLSQGHDITEVNPKTGINSLHLAVLTGNYDIVELLSRDEDDIINSRCCLRGADCEGYTPLHFSVDVCNKRITRLLLSRTAKVNCRNKYGNTALHVATRYGVVSEETIRFLLNGGKLYSKNDNRLDIVHCIKRKTSTMYGYCVIADILLRSRANCGLVNKNGDTALHLACQLEDDTMAEKILIKCSSTVVDYENQDMRTALHIAASTSYNNWQLVKLLIECNADINATDDLGCTPLYYACKEKKLKVVQILVENGCNVNKGGSKKPINIAVNNCDLEILKLLLKHGVDTSHIDSFPSPNIPSFEKTDHEIYLFESCCKVFFKRNMDIFGDYRICKNVSGKCLVSYCEVFKLLLQHGCIKNIDRKHLYFGHILTIPTSFVKFVIKIKTLGCFFARDYPDIVALKIVLLPDEEEYEESCIKEVEILRRKFVCSDISILDFLKKDLNKMVTLLKNQEIVNVMKCSFGKILPIYDDLIKAFFKYGMQQRSML